MKLPRVVILSTLAIAGAIVSSGPAYAAPALFDNHKSDVVGHAYVNDNTAGENTVAGFDRHADGSLTPIPGSPFSAGGAGLGKGLATQGAIQLSRNGRFLLAVDAGSNQISVLRLGSDGVPFPVGPPVSSGGSEPVSIAVSGSLVYVANAGAGETNITGFRLAPWGALYAIPGSTVTLPAGSGPDDVLFDPRGRKLVVNLDNTSSIASFHVAHDGLLEAAPGSPIAAQGAGPFGAEFRPTNPSQLFVSNAHGGAGNGTVSAFLVARTGQIAPIGASPFANFQTASCWVEITHDGKFLFTVNTGSGTISRYAINPDGSLVLLGSTAFGSAGAGAVDARLSPDGTTLLVVGSKADVVASFAVNGGELTPLESSPTPLPAGAVATGIVTN
jgi:6-phosphogluconolactonase (cycloisomerase 2 family)